MNDEARVRVIREIAGELCRLCTKAADAGIHPAPERAYTSPLRPLELMQAAALALDQIAASIERRALPIAIGDPVFVLGRPGQPGQGKAAFALLAVGPKLVKLDSVRRPLVFRREDGKANDNYGHRQIDRDDLARIERCFPGRAKP